MTRALLLIVMAVLAHAQTGIVGRWRSVKTSSGGIGSIIEFLDDGSMRESPGAIVDMKYRIEGDRLILPPATTTGPEQVETIQWIDANHLALKLEQAPVRTLKRVGQAPDAANPILGEWIDNRDFDGKQIEAHFLFKPSGKALLVMPFAMETGRYSVKDGRIRFTLPKRAPLEGSFRMEGDILVISNPSTSDSSKPGRESRYQRY